MAATETKNDTGASTPELFEQITAQLDDIRELSDAIILGTVALRDYIKMVLPQAINPTSANPVDVGTKRLCQVVSAADTLAANQLGLDAYQESYGSTHFITYFGPPDKEPSDDDLVYCRTWGQFDEPLYGDSTHPRSGKPFFGTRKEFAELLPHAKVQFDPKYVSHRSIIHPFDPDTPYAVDRPLINDTTVWRRSADPIGDMRAQIEAMYGIDRAAAPKRNGLAALIRRKR